MIFTEKVFIANCDSYDYDKVKTAVFRMLDGISAEKLLEKGKKVLIKANLVIAKAPDCSATTDPSVVRAVSEYFVNRGAEVTIADSPGGLYNQQVLKHLYNVCGMTEAAEKSGAKLNFDVSSRQKIFEKRTFDLISPVFSADVIVSCAKIKTHSLTYFTGAVKNLYGTVPGATKAVYHAAFPKVEDFSELIVDLYRAVNPDLAVIDGVYGMEGNGPTAGTPKFAGVLIASRDSCAADICAMKKAGLDPSLSPIHKRAEKLGLVPDFECVGDELTPLETPFSKALENNGIIWKLLKIVPKGISKKVSRYFKPYPIISERCIGCGTCAGVCPQKTIKIIDKKAVIDRKKCIKCYCCHELCPIKAVDMR